MPIRKKPTRTIRQASEPISRHQDIQFPDLQFYYSSGDRLRPLSVSLASRAFFKWIKQHLRVKSFFGTSQNTVKSQIRIAISVYVLVAIIKKRLGLKADLYTILQILSLTLFEKIPLDQILIDSQYKSAEPGMAKLLNLFDYSSGKAASLTA